MSSVKGDAVAVDGLDHGQPVLTTQSGLVIGRAMDTEMKLCIAHRADLADQP